MTGRGGVAATSGRVAAFYGPGKPMVINEYPVPEPAPGAIVVKTTLANICGSDLQAPPPSMPPRPTRPR
jgi:threonine dehydrogenase-like Zn-dependent dehydrogenase